MIAKRVRKHGGKGLAALVRYVLREKGPPRDWKRRAADAPGPGGRGGADGVAGGKVDRVRVSGCGAVTDPGRAVRLMGLTAAANPTVRAGGRLDAGYHLVASFAPGERPGREALDDIEDTLVRAVGLEEHQRVSAAHKDRGHFHLHVVVNTVHPVRFTKADLRFDHRALACAPELDPAFGRELAS